MPIQKAVPIVKAEEPWVTLHLADGSVLRARVNIAEVFRVEGVWDQNGDPVYNFKSQTMVTVTAPEGLRKPQAVKPSAALG